jgi:2-aminoethylphosphonate-pyruvate transaminase
MRRTILLNPGPVTLSDRVRSSLVLADQCHREPEFAQLTKRINAQIESVYPTPAASHRSVVMTGSGTAAVEAMLVTFAPADSMTLVVSNGAYGERAAAMLKTHRSPVSILEFGWTAGIDLDRVSDRLRQDVGIGAVFAVHHETTTGRLNDLAALGKVCALAGKPLLIDAVSSFGAEEVDLSGWNIAACAASANKCMHGAPGAAFVVAAIEQWRAANAAPSSFYLDLRRHHDGQRSDGYSPFTQSVPVFYALDEALREHREAGGWKARQASYQARSQAIREALAELDFIPLLDAGETSCALQSFYLPEGVSFEELHGHLKARNVVIYSGQHGLADKIFRVANMGEIPMSDIEYFAEVLGEWKREGRR